MIDVLKPHFTGKDLTTRQEALIRYVQQQPRQGQNGHINLHVHTNESFSFFQNPTEVVWYAYVEGIEYFGINDHYTISGSWSCVISDSYILTELTVSMIAGKASVFSRRLVKWLYQRNRWMSSE